MDMTVKRCAVRTIRGAAIGLVAVSGLLLLPAGQSFSSPSPAVTNTTDYSITISGLSLAKASFQTVIDGRNFQIQGNFRTTGLARLFKRVEGTANVSGRFKGNAFVPTDYKSDYTAGKDHKVFTIAFADRGVKSFKAEPGIHPLPANWVAVTPEVLASAVDPLSGLLLPADQPLCKGTINVFDGEAVTALQLTEKGDKTYKAGDQQLAAHVCGLTVAPEAGYRKGRSDMEYVARLKGMEIWFAKSPVAAVYAPVRIVAPTSFGKFEIAATRFSS